MKVEILEYCPSCPKQFVVDSERYYWHLKIHLAKQELTFQAKKEESK